PKAWCEAKGIQPRVYNSIINKTALSAETNRIIGGNAPSAYLGKIEKRTGMSPADVDAILETHLINPALLRRDDFEDFFADREGKLAALAASAMGKPVVGDMSAEEGVVGEEDLSVDEEETLEEAA